LNRVIVKANGRKVVFVKSFVKEFRVPFYTRLREDLARDGIDVQLIFGQPDRFHAADSDIVKALPFARTTKNVYWQVGAKSVCWQPALAYLRDADLVIVQQGNRHLLNHLLLVGRRAMGFRLGFWGHGRNFQNGQGSQWLERFKKLYSTRADHWFAYTQKSRRVLESIGYPSDRITVVQNAVDARRLAEHYDGLCHAEALSLRRRLGFEPDQPVGVYCGKLYGLKDLDFLLRCAGQIHARNARFGLILIGDGPERGKVERFARDHADWVRYVGPQYGTDKAGFFRLANCLLLPGAVGLTIVDAFAMLTPLITVDNPRHGPEIEYLEDGVNGLKTPASEEAYVAKVAHYLRDFALQRRLVEGCQRARSLYTIENMTRRFAEGIRTALNRETRSFCNGHKSAVGRPGRRVP